MINKAFRFNLDSEGIARLVFDLSGEKINKFSQTVMEELEKLLDKIQDNPSIKVLFIESGKKNIFIAGADIKELEVIKDTREAEEKSRSGQLIFDKLAVLPFPTVALIDGACLGGGLEFALACTYRLATDNRKTILGCPEVKLGILPGWGGTQRLPKLIGLAASLPLLLSGRSVPAKKAYKLKLIDAIIASEFKEEKSQEFLQNILTAPGRKKILNRRKSRGLISLLLEKNPLGRKLIFTKAKKDILKRSKGHYPAPLLILKLIQKTYSSSLKKGLKKEAESFAQLAPGKISKNLIRLFYINEALKKDAGEKEKTQAIEIRSAGILGAGVMGGGIAWAFTNKDIPVRLKDISWEAISKAYASMQNVYKQLMKRRKITPGQMNLKMHHLTGSLNYSGYGNTDLVVEAIVEDIKIKKNVLAELEKKVKPRTLICSNTSTLSISEIGSALQKPERFAGMHFFNPVNRMPLVEVIPGEKTSSRTIASIILLARKIGKIPIVVKDSPGFLVNRILIPYMIEATVMLQEGIDLQRIDKLLENFGMPMGPFLLADEVGIDICFKVSRIIAESLNIELTSIEILRVIYEERHLTGKKGKKGFYLHNGKKKTFNKDINDWIKSVQEKLAIKKRTLSDKEIIDRAILTMVNAAAQCLFHKVIDRPEYLDMAMILGIGFPPFRGGLLCYADELGIGKVVETLRDLEKVYGKRFEPSPLLIKMAESGLNFYSKTIAFGGV